MPESSTYDLHLGVDVSKGYSDLQLLNAAGSKMGLAGRFDDTPAGHEAVRTALAALLDRLRARGERPHLIMGVEASGGLERNWLRLFQSLAAGTEHRVYRLNPLAVKRFRDQELHYSVTDPLAAEMIAEYLRRGLRKADVPHTEPEAGALILYRYTDDGIHRLVQLKNQLQSLLPSVHPDLVQFCHKRLPEWILALLARYPTVTQLAAARPATLARLPYVTSARAEELVAAARISVAALRDPHSGEAIKFLVRDIRNLEHHLEHLKQKLCTSMQEDPVVKILVSIPGIGWWTATVLRLEIGRFDRFHSAAAVVAFAGLDPAYFQSGDGSVERHISKRGRSQIRAGMWMCALTGIRCNPALRDYYQHLLREGKRGDVALVACAAKLLRIAFACVVSEKPFDPTHAAKLRAQHAASAGATAEVPGPAGTAPCPPPVGALSAPVSSREAKRRKAAAPATDPRVPRKPAETTTGATGRAGAKPRDRAVKKRGQKVSQGDPGGQAPRRGQATGPSGREGALDPRGSVATVEDETG